MVARAWRGKERVSSGILDGEVFGESIKQSSRGR